jgi:hypothetical protein
MISLPEQPWEKDDTFTVEETGLVYTYDGEKWLAASGEELDLDLTPVTDRLDDIEEVLPKVPLVVEPVDLGRENVLIDYPQRPSGTNSPPAGECWMWHLDAGRTPGGNTPANEMKVVVTADAVSNIILDGTTEVWFKQGDRVQKWNCLTGGWFTAGNLWHISAQSTEGDDLVEGQPFEVYYLDPNATGDDLIEVISRMESKADDRKLQAEIEVLSGELSTLVKSQEDGEWTYKGELPEVPRNAGEFILATSTLTSEMNSVYVNETDLNGITHNFTAPVGSYIEIVDEVEPMDYVLFEVTDEPQGTGLIQIDVKMVKAGNPFDLGYRCIIRFFEVTDALDINELDNRYLQLAGGVMKGDLYFDGPRQISYIDDDGQNWVQFKLGATTEYRGQYGASEFAIATRKRVEDAVAGLASEEWVTGQLEAIDIPDTDLTGYATELYVNQQINMNLFSPGDQVAKVGSSSNNTGAFWIVDGALYCKV